MPRKIFHCKLRLKTSTAFPVSRVSWLPLLLLAAGFLACLSGCGVRQLTRGELEAPRVKFQSLAVGLPTPRGLPLACTLLVENHNLKDLRVLGYDYQLRLEGQEVLQGVSREAVTLPARGQVLVHVPLLVNLKALPRFLPAILRNERLNYKISGGVRLASLLGGFRVPFSFQGQVTPKEGREQLQQFLK